MVSYVFGDVTQCREDVLIHGVNCQRVMGKGVALQIANKWPIVKEHYLSKREWFTGQTQWVKVQDDSTPQWVVNAATQNYYGYKENYVDYNAVYMAFDSVIFQCKENGFSLASPMIGAGLGGASWDVISEIIENVSGTFVVHVYVNDRKKFIKLRESSRIAEAIRLGVL